MLELLSASARSVTHLIGYRPPQRTTNPGILRKLLPHRITKKEDPIRTRQNLPTHKSLRQAITIRPRNRHHSPHRIPHHTRRTTNSKILRPNSTGHDVGPASICPTDDAIFEFLPTLRRIHWAVKGAARTAQRTRFTTALLVRFSDRKCAIHSRWIAEPAVVEEPEVSIAVRATDCIVPPCGTGVGRQRRRRRCIRGVVVERSRGLVLDGDPFGIHEAIRIRRVEDVAGLPGPEAPEHVWSAVPLHLPGAPVHLVEEAVIGRVASSPGMIRAGVPHRAAENPRRRTRSLNEPLLLLERDENDLRADPARSLDFEDDPRGGLAGCTGVSVADGPVLRTRGRRLLVDIETKRILAGTDLCIQECLDLRLGHRVAVVEVGVADDVPGIEFAYGQSISRCRRGRHDESNSDHETGRKHCDGTPQAAPNNRLRAPDIEHWYSTPTHSRFPD